MQSMTGYGKGSCIGDDAQYSVEIKTVNHRYADVTIKLPRVLLFLESEVKSRVNHRLARGKIDVYVNREATGQAAQEPVLNEALADAYMRLYKDVAERYQLTAEVPLPLLLGQKDVVALQEVDLDEEVARRQLFGALDLAIDAAQKMRAVEGDALQTDIEERLQNMESLLAIIEGRTAVVVMEWQAKLRGRIERLMGDVDCDPQRLAQELALFADRCDISEEVVRFKSHLVQFRQLFSSKEPVGRQMDFLIQELNRETNTMGSKSNDAELTRQVVSIKAELEKVREQVQNVE